jgi:LacI family transcriptional regulator
MDVAVVGFDDIPLARYVTPALTTVRVPMAELGARALNGIADVIGGEGGEGRASVETLATALVVRASCRRAPQGNDDTPID